MQVSQKVSLFSMPPSQVIDLAILADVIKAKEQNFSAPALWWTRVKEDAQRIRKNYMQYSDSEIVRRGSKIQQNIAASVKDYLIQYFGYN